jgi:arylsulfatase A
MIIFKSNYHSVLIIALSAMTFWSCKTETVDRPNVVFIMADDLGYGDLSCLGQEKLHTPNIDRIAKEGMIFTNHYSGNTVCSPSRATLSW